MRDAETDKDQSVQDYKLAVLVILISLGVVLQLGEIVELSGLINAARQYSERWWLGLLLVMIQILLFTFAMPGSSLVWISAALFSPLLSTLLIAAGTTLGGLSAYLFSRRLSLEWTHKVNASKIYRILSKEGNFVTLLALRVMPGFPHSLINYSSGILHLKLMHFIPATLVGASIKAHVYSVLIYNATTVAMDADKFDLSTVWPLSALSLALLAIILARYYLKK